jgi:hypothetical protein
MLTGSANGYPNSRTVPLILQGLQFITLNTPNDPPTPITVQEEASHYRKAKSSEQLRIAENLQEFYTTAGVLLVNAVLENQLGHGARCQSPCAPKHPTVLSCTRGWQLSEKDRFARMIHTQLKIQRFEK